MLSISGMIKNLSNVNGNEPLFGGGTEISNVRFNINEQKKVKPNLSNT